MQLEKAKSDLTTLASGISPEKKIVLLSLPRDYCGAPMLSRAEYLQTFCKPPCLDMDLSHRVFGIEQPTPGAHEFIYVHRLSKILSQHAQDQIILTWSNQSGCFIPWRQTEGSKEFSTDFQPRTDQSKNSILRKNLFSFTEPINTLSAGIAKLSGTFESNQTPIRFYWHALMPSLANDNGKSVLMSAPADYSDSKSALFDLQKYPEWTYATKIVDFGLELPQNDHGNDLQNLSILPAFKLQPQLDLDSDQAIISDRINSSNLNVSHFSEGHSLTLSFSVEAMPDACGVEIEIPAHGRSFPELFLSSPARQRPIKTITKRSGQFTLSDSELKQSFPDLRHKMAQLRALAINSSGQRIGLPSEPVSFSFDMP